MSETKLEFSTPFLNHYMRMVEETESPRLFHVWSAVSAVAAALGRRCWLPFGDGQVFPNHYILIVGTPGTRKSTAMGISRKQITTATGVRLAPGDTGGQRQGLISALQAKDLKKEVLHDLERAAGDKTLMSLTPEMLYNIDNSDEAQPFRVSDADRHHLMVCASEFTRFIGNNNGIMLDFLGEMWDGDDIKYQLKSELVVVKEPLLNILGCTTPVHIAQSMPPNAGGQGFLSRMILVYGGSKYKSVARPPKFPEESVRVVQDTLSRIFNEMHGEFYETSEALTLSESLYQVPLDIPDPRFQYYGERRYTHLLKLAMVLAAMRFSRTIVAEDYAEADRILRATERGMPDALGQFGLSPIAQLKQGILDFLRHVAQPVSLEVLRATFHRDARPRDMAEAIQDLNSAGQIKSFATANNGVMISAVLKGLDTKDSELINLLAER